MLRLANNLAGGRTPSRRAEAARVRVEEKLDGPFRGIANQLTRDCCVARLNALCRPRKARYRRAMLVPRAFIFVGALCSLAISAPGA